MTAPDPAERNYDQYMSLYEITRWENGEISGTRLVRTGWFPMEDVDANQPAISGLVYAPASDAFARDNMTIRTRPGG